MKVNEKSIWEGDYYLVSVNDYKKLFKYVGLESFEFTWCDKEQFKKIQRIKKIKSILK